MSSLRLYECAEGPKQQDSLLSNSGETVSGQDRPTLVAPVMAQWRVAAAACFTLALVAVAVGTTALSTRGQANVSPDVGGQISATALQNSDGGSARRETANLRARKNSTFLDKSWTEQAAPRAAQLVVKRLPDAPTLPSLYCFVFVVKDSAEPWLLRVHLARGTGVFGCDSHNVFAEEDLDLGEPGSVAPQVVPLPGEPAWHGPVPGSTELVWHNTGVFARAWRWIYQAGPHRSKDWTAKIDPDTAFLPGRLQRQLFERYEPAGEIKDYTKFMKYLDPKLPMFLVNCQQWYSLQGPMEVFSQAAADKFFAGVSACQSKLTWDAWGEDWFVEHCMDELGVQKREGFGLLADMYCESAYSDDGKSYLEEYKANGPSCKDGRPAYHAYKTVQSLTMCLDQAGDAADDLRVYKQS